MWEDDDFEEPPLYPEGKLRSMTDEELEREADRQADTQGRLGDADYINEYAVARAESRWRMCINELNRRKAADK